MSDDITYKQFCIENYDTDECAVICRCRYCNYRKEGRMNPSLNLNDSFGFCSNAIMEPEGPYGCYADECRDWEDWITKVVKDQRTI